MSTSRRKETAIGAAVALAATASVTGAAQAADVTVENTNDSGPGSLRSAITAVNESGADRILFKSGLTGEITLTSSLPPVKSPVKIAGPGMNRLRINGADASQIFEVYADATITGFTLTNGFRQSHYQYPYTGPKGCAPYCDFGYSGPAGGALSVHGDSDVTVRDARMTYNYGAFGGAIGVAGSGSLRVADSEFRENRSTKSGGAISVAGTADSRISGCTFTGNSTKDSGGAVKLTGSSSNVRYSFFDKNSSYGPGGAAYVRNESGDNIALVKGSTFDLNRAGAEGGAVAIGGVFSFSESSLTRNTASLGGGAISATPGSTSPDRKGVSSISGSLISGNTSGGGRYRFDLPRGGGGIRIQQGDDDGKAELSNLTVIRNVAINGSGGGIESSGRNTSLDSVTITGNRVVSDELSAEGGGLNQNNGKATVSNSIISGNTKGPVDDISDLSDPGVDGPAPPKVSAVYSLIGRTKDFDLATTVPGSNLRGVDPMLSAPALNGGPMKTMKPKPDSPVVNRGSTGLRRDGRGLVRPVRFGGRRATGKGSNLSDMGAVELQDNRFGIGRVRSGAGGRLRLEIDVRSAGKATLFKSQEVARATGRTSRPKVMGLRLRIRGRARRRLERTGQTKVRVAVRFYPSTGDSRLRSKTLTVFGSS